ncbi:hypothetical protein DXG03_002058 [Asterophora parasitica]|uniref:Hcy-binding domain-containing protein n=1 Tax=Asterophora parasitica TaxID=117018 RepID=A0A9P7G2F5_9AGAR|nr:hypothetical protein DXG03_002058 [Asterophora parasitica]
MDISSSPLWSAQQILDHPETIIGTHLAFLRAGARIILTSTYQASGETFRRAGYSDSEAKDTMLKAVTLANDARTAFVVESSSDTSVKIALSLGPFGASLSPTQEFDGFYPPPYGPMGSSDSGPLTNTFDEGDVDSEQASIFALAQFHLERLLVFARDPEAWSKVDIIAFETVPLIREVKGIRLAMHSLENTVVREGLALQMKPWWVGFVLPEGKCPELRFPGGLGMTVDDLVSAAFAWKPSGGGDAVPTPTGIGINCTSPKVISGLVRQMSTAVEQVSGSRSLESGKKPWLVLYPNGGDVYDTITRSWIVASKDERELWAVDLKDTIVEASKNCAWGGVVVGGCCRAGPELIRRLDDELKHAAM